MQPATPARPARAPSAQQHAPTSTPPPAPAPASSSSTANGSARPASQPHPAHGAGSWRPRVRSTTGYATPAMKVRRRTVSEQSSAGGDDDDNDDGQNDAANGLESTPGLDSDVGDTPSTGASARLAPSLPITPATPLLRYVPRGKHQAGRLQPQQTTTTPSKPQHVRHHTSPLHRTQLGQSATVFDPPVEVIEVDNDDDDDDERDTAVDDASYGVRHLRLSTAAGQSTPSDVVNTTDVADRADLTGKAASAARKTPDRQADSAPPKFFTPPPASSAAKPHLRVPPATAGPTVRPGATWQARRALSPTAAASQASVPPPPPPSATLESAIAGKTEPAPTTSSTVGPPPASADDDPTLLRTCGSCEDVLVKQAVKVSPCGCSVCRKCFTSGMNVVCDVAGGIMRCPACTTTVEDFKTIHLTPDPKAVAAATAAPAAARKASSKASADAAGEDDGKPVFLRFDNASWDVTPEMIVNFLPAGALPEPAQNPHPIHLLIHPADGKTKDFFFVEVVSKKAAAAVIKACQSTVLGEGKRARPVTITISNAVELQREIQPFDARTLQGVLGLCQAAFSTKKSYIKRKSFPFLYLMSILTRADLTGLEVDALVTFQGAALVISNVLESGVASPDDLALAGALYAVLLKSTLITPILCGPYIGVVPGRDHPLSRPPPPQLQQAQQQQQQQQNVLANGMQQQLFHFMHPANGLQPPMVPGLAQHHPHPVGPSGAAYLAYPHVPPPGLGVVYPRINSGPLRI